MQLRVLFDRVILIDQFETETNIFVCIEVPTRRELFIDVRQPFRILAIAILLGEDR